MKTTLAALYHRHGFGFVTDADLPELVAVAPFYPCLVRCNLCRFTIPAEYVRHLVQIIDASGKDYVRDVALIFDSPPPRPFVADTARKLSQFRPEDIGGAFDGVNISSDADPGL